MQELYFNPLKNLRAPVSVCWPKASAYSGNAQDAEVARTGTSVLQVGEGEARVPNHV
jgi:hypothetical protein